jgi:hypothetical protein
VEQGGRGPKTDEELIRETTLNGHGQLPLWLVQPDHARRLNCSYFELLDWIENGGSLMYLRFRHAWQIMDECEAEAAERRKQREKDKELERQGFKGGEAEDDSEYFEGESDDPAA